MDMLENLFQNNATWASERIKSDPEFFRRLARQQAPEYLWIGCSDSRVPANEIIGLDPGEVFVHRNVANLVIHSDMNCFSVLQFAVEVLKVRHVIVCGHYGCGGVRTALDDVSHGVISNWLRPIREIADLRADELAQTESRSEFEDKLCEFNVQRQVDNVSNSTVVTDAWRRGQEVTIHGWVYGLKDGLLRDLRVSRSG
ncbi:MAG: carbonate dehydratase [Proteobacteria bacterium]|nr:carbonate dehydratase [Pseudomonadota bacterium]